MDYLRQTLQQIIKGYVMNSNTVKNYSKVDRMMQLSDEAAIIDLLKCDQYGKYSFRDYALVKALIKHIDLDKLDDILFDVQIEADKKFK
jgi:uncharacterized protein YbcV (DUF1398 family)